MKHQLDLDGYRVALLLPCLNEELTLAKVIEDFREQIPTLSVYVFDNGSTDRSAEIARGAGATVIPVPKKGKGHVVRKMFETVEADLYIMVDSDDTYEASGVWDLLKPVIEGQADMTVGSRLHTFEPNAFRRFHRLGNALIQTLINTLFRSRLTDICSGYRVMSRHFVKNIPLLRDGFEVETELTVYSLIGGFSIFEVSLPYRQRPMNSFSKLHTFRDGYKVLLTIIWLARDLRPLLFFGGLALLLFLGVTLPTVLFSPNQLFWQLTLSFLSISLLFTGLVLNTLNIKFAELQLLERRRSAVTAPLDSNRVKQSPYSTKIHSLLS